MVSKPVSPKKALLVVIDALSSPVFEALFEEGRLPVMARLVERGTCRGVSASIFPSITPAATSTLATGCYPREHGIQGAYWLDEGTDEVVYFGADFWVALQHGSAEFFDDFIYHLNRDRLQADTLFQHAERAGRSACSLNYMIHRGDTRHHVDMPWLVEVLPGLPSSSDLYGPKHMLLGDFLDTLPEEGVQPSGIVEDLTGLYGMDDAHTGDALVKVAAAGDMDELTVAYFPENDFESHNQGPFGASDTLEAVDRQLGRFVEAFGGLDALLDEYCVVLTGDHSQSDIIDDEDEAGIELQDVLSSFTHADYGTPLRGHEQLAVCPNLRAAQIYLSDHEPTFVERVEHALLDELRIDQVIRRRSFDDGGADGFVVRTADRGELYFWPGDDGPNTGRDDYGFSWSWEGSLDAVDARVDGGKLDWDTYPNAFERIAGGPGSAKSADLWVTARPGYEFTSSNSSVHVGGGSHGSLHLYDSRSPLLVAGAPAGLEVPEQPRAVDVALICGAAMGLEMHARPGDSHARRWGI